MIIGYETRVIEKHLSPAQERLLEFLKVQHTAAEMAKHLGVEIDSLYPNLRLFQRLDLIEKVDHRPNPNGAGRIAVFQATGRQPIIESPYMQIRAHDPFGMAA